MVTERTCDMGSVTSRSPVGSVSKLFTLLRLDERLKTKILTSMTDLAELDRRELEATLAALGAPKFHGRHIFRWIYKRGVTDPSAMTDLSQKLRETLAGQTTVPTPTVAKKQVSEDGTTKFLLKLSDGRLIESVYIPDTPAQTFCISTQV